MAHVNLTRKLVLEAPHPIPDGAGGFDESWIALGTIWAEVKAGSGREISGDTGPVSANTYRITVRSAPYGTSRRPTAEQRFVEGDRVFKIHAVSEKDPQGLYLTCVAKEEVAA